jgi:hypothetical protein
MAGYLLFVELQNNGGFDRLNHQQEVLLTGVVSTGSTISKKFS